MVLVNRDRRRAEGEVMDLAHAMSLSRECQLTAGDYDDLAGCDVVVVCAGFSRGPEDGRLELFARNAAIFREILPRVVGSAPTAILVIATNPVDLMTLAAIRFSGLPPRQVIGTGSMLATARFRYLLSRYCEVDAQSVHAFIIGELGDQEVGVFSSAQIGGVSLADYCQQIGRPFREAERTSLFEEVRRVPYEIIARKGATYYAIGSGLVRLVEAVLRDQNTVFTVSTLLTGQYGIDGICLSVPAIINRRGIARVLRLRLDERERAAFRRVAQVLREQAHQAGLMSASLQYAEPR
jgi:L-lactate dehydrogenase